jgi:hypothetical protein
MEKSEIERLRKAICRSFNSSPHKKKYWLALLDMRIETEGAREATAREAAAPSFPRKTPTSGAPMKSHEARSQK